MTPTAAPTRSRPRASRQALGCFFTLSMSRIVMSPLSRRFSSTRRSFSTRARLRMRSAASRVVSGGATTRLARVMTSPTRPVAVATAQERHVASGEDADHFTLARAIGRDGEAGDVLLGHERGGATHRVIGGKGDRVGDDAVLAALDLGDFAGLANRRHVLVDHRRCRPLGRRQWRASPRSRCPWGPRRAGC
jgi:hypothetical protein